MPENTSVMEEFPEEIADAVILETDTTDETDSVIIETVTEANIQPVENANPVTDIQEFKPKTKLQYRRSFLNNFDSMCRAGEILASSFITPSNYQGKPADCTIAVDLAERMGGISPLVVMQNLYIVKGKPSWSGQACIAFIKNIYRNVEPVYVGTPGNDDWGCYFKAVTSYGKEIKGSKVTIAMAKREGWYSKKDRYGNETSKWQSMPEQMLSYRAAAFFARVWCPEVLMGFSVEGEPEDIEANQQSRNAPRQESVQYACSECGKPFKQYQNNKGVIPVDAVYKMSCEKNADGVARCSECMNRLGKAKK